MFVLVVEELREADGTRGVIGQGQRAPVVETKVGPQIVGREADGCHFGHGGQLVADDIDPTGLFLGDVLPLRGTLTADDAQLAHAEVVFLKLACRYAEMGGIESDGEEVDNEPTQAGDDGYLGKYPTVLFFASPQTLQYHAHLFWFNDSTIGLRSDDQAGMRAAMRLSTAQQTKAMRNSVGVKNMSS